MTLNERNSMHVISRPTKLYILDDAPECSLSQKHESKINQAERQIKSNNYSIK